MNIEKCISNLKTHSEVLAAKSRIISVGMFQEMPVWFHVGLACGAGLCRFDLV